MDILTHTVSGIAVSTVIAANFKLSLSSRVFLLCTGAIASALPDIDAISLWSGFDSSLGRWFGLTQSGKNIYFSKLWYSHHAFMHSLAAAFLFGFLLVGFAYLTKINRLADPKFKFALLIAFISSYTAHLIGDLPTPSSVWGGVNLFWPSDVYVGGMGKIWWWNNYDIFLVLLGIVLVNIVFITIGSAKKVRVGWMATLIFLSGMGFVSYQIEARPVDFSYTGHAANYQYYEKRSLEVQEDILGKELFGAMKKLDDHLNFYF